jgi:DMSO/TMAO reductase YedYZ heme-binding membrane subunit
MYKGIPATAMLSIRNAAYMAITLHFLRKITARIIPNKNVRYMVTAIHPNKDMGELGHILDKVLIIVMAQETCTVLNESITPTTVWDTILLPVNKLADYAKIHGIRTVLPIWTAPWYVFHGTQSATNYLHGKIKELNKGMGNAPHMRLREIAAVIQIIRDKLQ